MTTQTRHIKGFPNPNGRKLNDLYYKADWMLWRSEVAATQGQQDIWEGKFKSYIIRNGL